MRRFKGPLRVKKMSESFTLPIRVGPVYRIVKDIKTRQEGYALVVAKIQWRGWQADGAVDGMAEGWVYRLAKENGRWIVKEQVGGFAV